MSTHARSSIYDYYLEINFLRRWIYGHSKCNRVTLPTGKFCMLFCRLLIFFFLLNLFEKFFQEHFVGPDLGPNCLQRLSADDTCR